LKFIIDNWMLILMAATSGGLLLWPMLQGARGGIGTAEAVQLINQQKGVLVDVGEPAEFAAGHAAGARNVPLGQLGDDAGKDTGKDSGKDTGKKGLPTNKTLPLVVLCPTGARAGRAVALLRKAGYEKAVALSGGTAAWRDANLPVEKSAA
jgi:rhodanese-related sulfurtransferase